MFETISNFVGDNGAVFEVGPYVVVEINCDRWTFSEEHEIDMILEALSRYED